VSDERFYEMERTEESHIMTKASCGAVVALAACLVSGCGGGSWVDFPLGDCGNLELIKKNENAQTMVRAVCSNVGKAFTGDVRCENNAVQIKCK
jgi:hypothetical protein